MKVLFAHEDYHDEQTYMFHESLFTTDLLIQEHLKNLS